MHLHSKDYTLSCNATYRMDSLKTKREGEDLQLTSGAKNSVVEGWHSVN